jgi:hypothetical protein
MSTRRTNAPESEALSLDDAAVFEAARSAATLLKKTFETWVTIGRAVVRARQIADQRGGGKTFMRLIHQQGLGPVVPKATASRLERIMAQLPGVEEWRLTLTVKQQIEWASPSSVCSRCPALKKQTDPARRSLNDALSRRHRSPNSELRDLRRENKDLKAHIGDLEAARPFGGPMTLPDEGESAEEKHEVKRLKLAHEDEIAFLKAELKAAREGKPSRKESFSDLAPKIIELLGKMNRADRLQAISDLGKPFPEIEVRGVLGTAIIPLGGALKRGKGKPAERGKSKSEKGRGAREPA